MARFPYQRHYILDKIGGKLSREALAKTIGQNCGAVNGILPAVFDSSICLLKGLLSLWHDNHSFVSIGKGQRLLAIRHGESFVSRKYCTTTKKWPI